MANLYTGFHAVEERLRRYSAGNENGISLHIFYSKPGPRIKKIIALANSCGVENSVVSEKQLDTMAGSLNAEAREHRGIILSVEGEGERGKNLMDLNQWISTCPENALVVLLDSVTDPHNVGAIIRSCDQFGADLVIIPDHRGADGCKNKRRVKFMGSYCNCYKPGSFRSDTKRQRILDLWCRCRGNKTT